jgi:hypothetical protein
VCVGRNPSPISKVPSTGCFIATTLLGARLGTWTYECVAQTALVQVLLATEGLRARDAIETALRRASVLVERSGAAVYAPRIHLARADLACLAGEAATADRELRHAHRLLVGMAATGAAQQVAERLAAATAG